MKRPEPESPEAERRSQTAAEWLARCDRGLSAAEQDDFLQWRALHRHVVGDFSALAHWRPEHSEEPNPDLLAPARRRRIHWLAPTLLAAAPAIALAAFWWRAAPLTPTAGALAPVAPTWELKRLILEDGSSVELNHGANVTTEFSASERRATLVRGEALFTVAKNPARPFIVRAGGVDVRAVGTAFSVRLDAAAVEVLVTEGRVALARAENGEPRTGDRSRPPPSAPCPLRLPPATAPPSRSPARSRRRTSRSRRTPSRSTSIGSRRCSIFHPPRWPPPAPAPPRASRSI